MVLDGPADPVVWPPLLADCVYIMQVCGLAAVK